MVLVQQHVLIWPIPITCARHCFRGASASAESNNFDEDNRSKLVFVNGLLFAVLLTAAVAQAQPASSRRRKRLIAIASARRLLDIRVFNRPQLSRDAVRSKAVA